MGQHHDTIIKLSKVNIAIGIASYIALAMYILSIILAVVGMNETEIQNMEFPWYIFVFLGLLMISVIIFSVFDVIIGIYAITHLEGFYNHWIPWCIAGSSAAAFFFSPFLGIYGMFVNIAFCRNDIRDFERNDVESARLINNNNNNAIVTTATVVYPIPSSNVAPSQPPPPPQLSSQQQQQQQQQQMPIIHAQPVYYATPVQYPSYGQQRPSAAPVRVPISSPMPPQQQHMGSMPPPPPPPQAQQIQGANGYGQIPNTNAYIPHSGTSPVASIYPSISSSSSSSSNSSSSSVNIGPYGYVSYNYDQK